MWISELNDAMLGTIVIGKYDTAEEAYEKTDKWLRENKVSDGETESTMLEMVNSSFSCDVYVYEEEEDND